MRVLFLIFLVMASPPLLGQGFPSKAIRIIVPFSPGGVADSSARVVPEQFTEQIRADLGRWEKVVKQAKIKVE